MKNVLGVDCGNVILEQMNGTPVNGSVNALRTITGSGIFTNGGVNIWIISKCGPRVQALTRQWLDNLDFWNQTGIPKSNLEFCLKFWEKGPICERLGVTHFIDDRPKVLNCLTTVGKLYAFNPRDKSMSDYYQKNPMTVVRTWDELLFDLIK
jgi:hypothetical protein